jgi:hypothetical protein
MLTLSNSFVGPFAKIDDTTVPIRGCRLMISRFFNPRHVDALKSADSKFHFVSKVQKGLMILPETEIGMKGEKEPRAGVCVMHLRSSSGDSGAGIFSIDGGLLTILATGGGNKYSASAPSIPKFREIAHSYNIPVLGAG